MNGKSKAFSLRRLVVASTLATVVTMATWLLGNQSAPMPETETKPAVVVNDQHQPTTLQEVKNDFGPFAPILVARSTPTPDTAYPAVLLLMHDGSTQASASWTISIIPTEWDSQGTFWVKGGEVDLGYVTFQIPNGTVYVVRVGQPFVIEMDPSKIIYFDGAGIAHSMEFTRAKGVRDPLAIAHS